MSIVTRTKNTHPGEGSPHGVVDRAPQSPQGPGRHAELLFPPELHHLEKIEKVYGDVECYLTDREPIHHHPTERGQNENLQRDLHCS